MQEPKDSAMQPISGKQLFTLGLRAVAIVLFWPLAWLWLAHFVVSHLLLAVGWEPGIPSKHKKVMQLQDAFSQATCSASQLASQLDAVKQTQQTHSCQLRLVQNDYQKQSLELNKLKQALVAKDVEIKAYRQALGCDSPPGEPANTQDLAKDLYAGDALEPNTPEERARNSATAWPAAGPCPPPPRSTASSCSASRAESDTRKLSHNWDWDDLLDHMNGSQYADDNQHTQTPALEVDRSYSEQAPREFQCPLTCTLISDPVVTPAGITYDRHRIMEWLASKHSDPASGAPLQPSMLYPNLALRDLIQKWLVENRPPSTAPSTATASPATLLRGARIFESTSSQRLLSF